LNNDYVGVLPLKLENFGKHLILLHAYKQNKSLTVILFEKPKKFGLRLVVFKFYGLAQKYI